MPTIIAIMPMRRKYEKGKMRKPLMGMRRRSPKTRVAMIMGTSVEKELLTGNATEARR